MKRSLLKHWLYLALLGAAMVAATGCGTLAGMALGHFFKAFFNDAFLGVRESRWSFAVEPARKVVFFNAAPDLLSHGPSP